ncbi:MAG: TAXI family TRAP transporter solute-binding subunit [Alphaproteobacteria bacterium]|jgi:TRAP transporter TAXI family solute receptor|nr:TAXI family TRAP transporter solute-binding subunit [Alphaproteobacteria bacterium]
MTHTLLRAAVPAALGTLLLAAPALAQDDWPDSFTVGTASQGGTYFTYGSGWANLVGEALGVTGGGEVTGGPVQNAALVQTGELEMGMVTMGPAFAAWTGNSPLAPGLEHDKLRAMFPMYQTPFSIITLASSGIDSVASIPDGASVGVGPAGGTSDTYFPDMLELLGADIEKRNGGASDLAGQLQDGLIDVFAFAAGVPVSAFSQLEAQVDVNIFGFTEDEVETLLAEFPVSRLTIPADTYQSTEADIQTVAMWNFAIASADLPEDFVYEVVKTVMENHDQMMEIHSAARETLPENYDKNTFLPWHPGAVRWFEENGYDIPDDLEG